MSDFKIIHPNYFSNLPQAKKRFWKSNLTTALDTGDETVP